jgi:ASC-1-like (ASCH) protein
MLTLESATNPVYANAEQTIINLQVKFVEIQEILPFSATLEDAMEYGRDIYTQAKNGEFGEILAYVPPTV